jgi:cell division septation protein DedD
MKTLRWVICVFVIAAAPAHAQGAAEVFARARQMVNEGDAKAGRALVDSMVAVAAPNSPAFAEALYWRGVLAEDGDRARTDLLRVAIEFSSSPRASDALLRLAQAEFTRGDRETALRRLDQLAREHPDAPQRAAGRYWAGRILLEDGKPADACTALRDAQKLVASGDVELANQIAFYARPCDAMDADAARVKAEALARADSVARADSLKRIAESGRRTSETAKRGKWSVQVAAYGDRDAATALVKRLKARGFEARVTSEKPWRVRVGHYATRSDAAEAARKLSSKKAKAMVVAAEKQ